VRRVIVFSVYITFTAVVKNFIVYKYAWAAHVDALLVNTVTYRIIYLKVSSRDWDLLCLKPIQKYDQEQGPLNGCFSFSSVDYLASSSEQFGRLLPAFILQHMHCDVQNDDQIVYRLRSKSTHWYCTWAIQKKKLFTSLSCTKGSLSINTKTANIGVTK